MTGAIGRPRLLHVVDSLAIGGMERNLATVVAQTADLFEHHVLCVREAGELAGEFVGYGVTVHQGPANHRNPFGVIAALVPMIRRLRPAIVHARNWGAIDALPAARLAGVPAVVYSEHGTRRLERVRRREWLRWAYSPLVDAFVSPSREVERFLVDLVGIPDRKIQTIANGVDTARFCPARERDRLRVSYGFEPTDRVVVAVGRLQPVKRYDLALESFATVVAANAHARMVLVGDGPDRPLLERRIEVHGLGSTVRLIGMRDDVDSWLRCADVFVHPSASEGSSNVILQALACGVPVVAADLPPNREMVTSGIDGTLLPIESTQVLADVLTRYVNDAERCRREGEAARVRVRESFPLARMIEGYTSLYQRLASGRR